MYQTGRVFVDGVWRVQTPEDRAAWARELAYSACEPNGWPVVMQEIDGDTIKWVDGINGAYWHARLECGHYAALPANWGRTAKCNRCAQMVADRLPWFPRINRPREKV